MYIQSASLLLSVGIHILHAIGYLMIGRHNNYSRLYIIIIIIKIPSYSQGEGGGWGGGGGGGGTGAMPPPKLLVVNFPINLRCYVLLGCRVIHVILAINIGDSAFFDIAD